MADALATIPAPAVSLRDWLVGGGPNVGEVRVAGADVAWDEDAEGESILRFRVTLADPSAETWPIEDIVEFHRRIEDQTADVGLDVPSYVGLETETQEELDAS